jgi:hypothetical protein
MPSTVRRKCALNGSRGRSLLQPPALSLPDEALSFEKRVQQPVLPGHGQSLVTPQAHRPLSQIQ